MNAPIHRIRLREPWIRTEAPGELVLYRRFGRPSHLEETQTVWIVISDMSGVIEVRCNDRSLPIDQSSWNITERLDDRNIIEVKLHRSQDPAAILNEVVLEIRSLLTSE